MPTALTELPSIVAPPRKRWTRAEFEAMFACTAELEQLELVDGELISTMAKGRRHVIGQKEIRGWLEDVFGRPFVDTEAPIDVAPEDNAVNEPVPDVVVLRRPSKDYPLGNPGPEDLRLVVEISATSLGFDLTTKARLYARAGIAEYWVLDIAGRRMIVHREPREGEYRSVEAYSEEESVAPLAAPESSLRVGELFV